MNNKNIDTTEYIKWIKEIKFKIHKARTKIALSVNTGVLELYWDIGKDIYTKQKEANWGSEIIDQIATDLKHEFPDMNGLSRRNIYAMRQWYLFYSQKFTFVPQVVAQIPWGYNRLIISKTKNIEEAMFYVQETINNNWSRDILEIKISEKLYQRQGKAITNFETILPENQSKLAANILKDPYNFDFLGLESDAVMLH